MLFVISSYGPHMKCVLGRRREQTQGGRAVWVFRSSRFISLFGKSNLRGDYESGTVGYRLTKRVPTEPRPILHLSTPGTIFFSRVYPELATVVWSLPFPYPLKRPQGGWVGGFRLLVYLIAFLLCAACVLRVAGVQGDAPGPCIGILWLIIAIYRA